MSIVYCCYGMYSDIGHSDDCPGAPKIVTPGIAELLDDLILACQRGGPYGSERAAVLANVAGLEERESLRLAGISTAALGYWKECDSIHPDYDTVALRDVAKLYAEYVTRTNERDRYKADAERYRELATPEVADFLAAVEREALHQRDRWGVENDGGKTDADWFWLIGYLAGKALHKPEKLLHHVITTAAACLNWHAARTGNYTAMRPGIADPDAAIAQRGGKDA